MTFSTSPYFYSEMCFSYSSSLTRFTGLSSAKVLLHVGGVSSDMLVQQTRNTPSVQMPKCPWMPDTRILTQPRKSQVLHIYTSYGFFRTDLPKSNERNLFYVFFHMDLVRDFQKYIPLEFFSPLLKSMLNIILWTTLIN